MGNSTHSLHFLHSWDGESYKYYWNTYICIYWEECHWLSLYGLAGRLDSRMDLEDEWTQLGALCEWKSWQRSSIPDMLCPISDTRCENFPFSRWITIGLYLFYLNHMDCELWLKGVLPQLERPLPSDSNVNWWFTRLLSVARTGYWKSIPFWYWSNDFDAIKYCKTQHFDIL